jgi:hypothetical protein
MPIVPSQLATPALATKSATSKVLVIGFILCGLTEFLLIISLIRDPSLPIPSILIVVMFTGTAILAHFLYVLILYHQSPSRGPLLATFVVTAIGTTGYCGANTDNRRWHFFPIAAVSLEFLFICFTAAAICQTPPVEEVREPAPFAPKYEIAPQIDLDWQWPDSEAGMERAPICYPASDEELGNLPVYGSVPFPNAI